MSNADDIVAVISCASCGKSILDGDNFTICADCKYVQYCSDECQQGHRPLHEAECKERVAEDENLFRQPESSHLGDCPICCVPMPINEDKRSLFSCCCKTMCQACTLADQLSQRNRQVRICPFCRHPQPNTEEEFCKNLMKRVEVNDPVALKHMAVKHFHKAEYGASVECWTKAAKLGDADAHYELSNMYKKGQIIEKDETKRMYHLKEAAVAGHAHARHNLGCHEGRNDRLERAVKHFIIAANLGFDQSMDLLKDWYKNEYVSKEELAAALRAHHAAVKATKSPQREAAQKYLNEYGKCPPAIKMVDK